MPWIVLSFAGLLEVLWAYTMKQSAGFTRLGPTLVTAIALLGSLGLLALAMRSLPLGLAYPIWTGIGTLGTFVVGILWLHEALTPMRILAALLVLAGITLMKLSHH